MPNALLSPQRPTGTFGSNSAQSVEKASEHSAPRFEVILTQGQVVAKFARSLHSCGIYEIDHCTALEPGSTLHLTPMVV